MDICMAPVINNLKRTEQKGQLDAEKIEETLKTYQLHGVLCIEKTCSDENC